MSGLALLHARWLWLCAGVLPIVLLYVLKARRRRVRVPSTWLWLGVQRDLQSRTPFQKLRRDLSLFLEILALLALAVAAASPSCRGRSIVGSHIAIVVDVSASMATVDEHTGRSRMDDARDATLRIIQGLAFGSDAMLVVAGHDARVIVALGRDRGALRRAALGLRAQDVEGNVGNGVALAIDRLRALSGDRRVLIVSDGQAGRADALSQGPIPMQLVRVGHPQDNVGIVRMDVRTARQEGQGETVQVFALLANHGARARDVYVTTRREGQTDVVASRRLRLEPNVREPVVLTFPFATDDAGRGVVVDVDPHDALAIDDVAYGRIPPGIELPVTLVGRDEEPWIPRALESDPNVRLSRVSVDHLDASASEGLLVFDGSCPSRLPARVDVLVLAPPIGHCGDVTVAVAVDGAEITSYAHTDARFRFLTMDGVHIARATPLALGPAANELLRSSEGVLFADVSTPERAVTVVGFDVLDTDWPLRASFVLFVRNIEELARVHRARAVTGGGRTGEPLRVPVPEALRRVDVRGPSGAATLVVTGGTAVVGETTSAGLYHLRWPSGETVAAVNMLSDLESDLRGPALQIDRGSVVGDVQALVRPHEDLLPYLAAFATVVLLLNLLWLTRRERKPSVHVAPVRPTIRSEAS